MINRTLLQSKIHRATVTEANLDYSGSVSIDTVLMQLADIPPHEQVDIYNITHGTRLMTYAIEAENDSGQVCVNGAAAHLMQPEDLIIICSYAQFAEAENPPPPLVIRVDGQNRVLG